MSKLQALGIILKAMTESYDERKKKEQKKRLSELEKEMDIYDLTEDERKLVRRGLLL